MPVELRRLDQARDCCGEMSGLGSSPSFRIVTTCLSVNLLLRIAASSELRGNFLVLGCLLSGGARVLVPDWKDLVLEQC